METQWPNATASRMLLMSDGSTTRLLESMLDEKLEVAVEQQHIVPASSIAPSIREHLAADATSRLLERRSMLLLPSGQWISRNYVVCKPSLPQPIWEALQSGSLPIGKIWDAHPVMGKRQLLGCGSTNDPADDEHRLLAYKHYVLWNETEPLMYVREHFHPAYVAPPSS
ncbi:DUF98 domain-containing protein [Xylanibacillus composti]|uniref:Chorismate lyase n=1 Tax=Xylanibacillus composti TaxID=1572762 RepID=A0A8J4H1R2_9BACL|nr:chorismate pyruvate-lyase family protein [Xylanibacillus composti]MDT9726721.1 DUF98 domain-containing protein [Xylanibacillus composti]GIQ69347.1 hypothetical protein XYCOK13_21710 [Xylanibacillus composti]